MKTQNEIKKTDKEIAMKKETFLKMRRIRSMNKTRNKVYIFIVFALAVGVCNAERTPLARSNHSSIYDPVNKQMILFGGVGQGGKFLSDTWIFDIEKKEWKEVEPEETPAGRYLHSAIYDLANRQVIMFGGSGQGGFLSDTWVFDIGKKEWKEVEAEKTPAGRSGHSTIYDSASKQIIIFGGIDQKGLFSDTWLFSIEKKEWEKIPSAKKAPARRCGHSAICDPMGKHMIIFGGMIQELLPQYLGGASPDTQRGVLSDTWVFDIEKKEWEHIKLKETPAGRSNHIAIYDPTGKHMIIFGGKSGRAGLQEEILASTWLFNVEKKEWEEVESKETPDGRFNHSAIYDSATKQMVVFGGKAQGGEILSDTWLFNIEKKEWKEVHSAGGNGKAKKTPAGRIGHSTIYDPIGKQMIIFGGWGKGEKLLSDTWIFNIEKKEWEEVK